MKRTITAAVLSETDVPKEDVEKFAESQGISVEEVPGYIEALWEGVLRDAFERDDSEVTVAVVAELLYD